MYTFVNKISLTAKARRLLKCALDSDKKPTDANVDHPNAIKEPGTLNQTVSTKIATVATTTRGNKQYPITQTD